MSVNKKKKKKPNRRNVRIYSVIMVLVFILGVTGLYTAYSHLKEGQKGELQQVADTQGKGNSVKGSIERPEKAVEIPKVENSEKNQPEDVSKKSHQDKFMNTEAKKDETKAEEPKNEKVVYMTFDDGPCATTPKLLDVLDKYDVKATFFVTAQFMNKDDLVAQIKEIHKRGHQVAVHSYSHEYGQIYSSVDAFMEDYKKMDDLIYEATGEHSKIFRFPGGSNTGYNSSIRDDLLKRVKEEGLIYFDWNAYDGDCDGYTGEDLIKRAVQESSYTNRSILLMHNIPGKDTVIDSLPQIIQQLKDAGYSFRLLDENVKPIQFA
ncbi:MAG TPA: polysaccharide deacetylase family protein [Candidatus Scybalocola faecavium]|nr:polysaccharide deacetylase family protein [Candidatus Scybalocola faecavium]